MALESIYDDVTLLQEQVAALQTQVSGLQTTVSSLQTSIEGLPEWQQSVDAALEDTGWIELPLNTGWSCPYNSDVVKYRKIRNVVYLRGLVNATQEAVQVIGTLPEGFRPSGHFQRYTCPHQQSDSVNIEVGFSGQIKDYTKPTNTGREFISLYGISFMV